MAKGKNTNFNTEDSKREDILNAAIAEFSHGYEKASTDAIVKSAGVSKGLLFHYFGSKKELFIATYEYAVNAMLSEFYDLVNLNQRDVLERWRQITLLKMDLMKKHPKIFTFIKNASIPDSEEVKQDVNELKNRLADKVYPDLCDDIDRTLFREDIDVNMAIHVIFFTMEGYAQSQANSEKSVEDYYSEYERYLNELERYIQFFKKSFYRQEEAK
ncbi:TetR/AcrR family transcriptional regulator [Caproiciproducens sp.]